MTTRSAPRAATLDRWFKITERGSTAGREIRGGVVTFFTMAYIVVLNPIIIGGSTDSSGQYLGGGSAPDLAAVSAATALLAGVLSILMGAVANFPMALAAGLGLNAFVAYTLAVAPGMTWADAMGLVVIEGIIILVLVLTGFREAVFRAVPPELKIAISVGIGLFITFVGLVNAGVVTPGGGTPVQLGTNGSLAGWPILVFVLGLAAIVVMMVRRVRGAIFYGVVGATVLAVVIEAVARVGARSEDNPTGWGLTVPALPEQVVDTPDFSLLGRFDLLGSFEALGVITVVLLVFSLLLADFFDTMGTMVAVGTEAGLLDEHGNPPATRRILVVDSLGAVAGGAASVSSNTSYVESTSGVAEGARTGLASIVTGVCFLLATFLAPLVEIVPYEAATPALVIVGLLMMQQVRRLRWDDLEIAVPAFLTIVLMPFTYSIATGIGAGFLAWVLVRLVSGKACTVHPLLWFVAVLFTLYFANEPLRALVG